jgi:hypothetical protein
VITRLALGLLAVVTATGCSHDSAGAFADRSEIPKHTPRWLVKQARVMATKSLGDAHPGRVRIRLGRVYVVEEWGDFTCLACSHPQGGSAPQGTHATLRVNPRTHQEISFSLGR